jgi:surface antigen
MTPPNFSRAAWPLAGREGYNNALLGEYTLLDVPGGGVTVIWSWNDSHNGQALAGNQAYVDGLSFG